MMIPYTDIITSTFYKCKHILVINGAVMLKPGFSFLDRTGYKKTGQNSQAESEGNIRGNKSFREMEMLTFQCV